MPRVDVPRRVLASPPRARRPRRRTRGRARAGDARAGTKAHSPPPPLRDVVFVLCRPEGAINVGTASRAMHNFGANDLRLVDPRCVDAGGRIDAEARMFAARGLDAVLERDGRTTTTTSVSAATMDATLVVATCPRPRENVPVVSLREGARRVAEEVARGGRVAVLFGTEKSGLSNDEMEHAQFAVCVPTAANVNARGFTKYTGGASGGETDTSSMSLNLGMAVGIVAYELFMAITDVRGDEVSVRGFASHRMTTAERERLIDDVVAARRALDIFPDEDDEEDRIFAKKERRAITSVFTSGPIPTKDATPLFMLARRARAFSELANATALVERQTRTFVRNDPRKPVSTKALNAHIRDTLGISLTRREIERAIERVAEDV